MKINQRQFDPNYLRTIGVCPNKDATEWLQAAEESIAFIESIAASEEVAIFVRAPCALIHAALAPAKNLDPIDEADLMRSFIDLDDSWQVQKSYSAKEGYKVYLEPPLSSHFKTFKGGEKLVFFRSFAGVRAHVAKFEFSQKLVHALELHWVPERKAYCRLDKNGDLSEVIRVYESVEQSSEQQVTAVTILRKDLHQFLALTGTTLVFRFDFTRFIPGRFLGWGAGGSMVRRRPELFYSAGSTGGASYVNGCLIHRSEITIEQIEREWQEELKPTTRKYETFKIYDRKNDRNVETSCAPDHLSNYFQKSDLPWEISPAFFRAEVLHRFKNDPDKYTLSDNDILCRSSWHLETYDINEQGQVHTYIGYLTNLPYEEQTYWKAFNEWPKGSISERAYKSDILGEWSSNYEPLSSLKATLREFDAAKALWWIPRDQSLYDAARHPATDSGLEWGNEILALDQLVNEGFRSAEIRAMVTKAGGKSETTWQSLKLLEALAEANCYSQPDAVKLVEPLRTLHGLRNPLRGHGSASQKAAEERKAREQFRTLRAHYTELCARIDASLKEIAKLLASERRQKVDY